MEQNNQATNINVNDSYKHKQINPNPSVCCQEQILFKP